MSSGDQEQNEEPSDAVLVEATERHRIENSIKELDITIASMDKVRLSAKTRAARKEELVEPWALFIRRMRLLTPQSWGSRVQNYLIKFYGWGGVAQKLDTGDAKLSNGELVEIKATMITTSNTGTNFVQLRPHQEIHGYRMFVIDRDYVVWRFDLTKAEMASEIELCGQSAHGTTAATAVNTNREWAIRFEWLAENEVRGRWLDKFYVPSTSVNPTPDLAPRTKYLTQEELISHLSSRVSE